MEGRHERTKIYGPTAVGTRTDCGGVIYRRDGRHGRDDGARFDPTRPYGAAVLPSLDDDGLQLELRLPADGGRCFG